MLFTPNINFRICSEMDTSHRPATDQPAATFSCADYFEPLAQRPLNKAGSLFKTLLRRFGVELEMAQTNLTGVSRVVRDALPGRVREHTDVYNIFARCWQVKMDELNVEVATPILQILALGENYLARAAHDMQTPVEQEPLSSTCKARIHMCCAKNLGIGAVAAKPHPSLQPTMLSHASASRFLRCYADGVVAVGQGEVGIAEQARDAAAQGIGFRSLSDHQRASGYRRKLPECWAICSV